MENKNNNVAPETKLSKAVQTLYEAVVEENKKNDEACSFIIVKDGEDTHSSIVGRSIDIITTLVAIALEDDDFGLILAKATKILCEIKVGAKIKESVTGGGDKEKGKGNE